MNQSVQVGLVFPRSGQELSIHISRQQADLLDNLESEHTLRFERKDSPAQSYPIHSQEKTYRSQ